MIKEELIHYLWKTHRLPKIGLQTTEGAQVEILKTGVLNTHDGPDFLNAQIRIDNVVWVGPVEMHIKSSDWYQHKHQIDPRYESVVLHVVLEENKPVEISGRRIPCIEVASYLKPDLVQKYSELQQCKASLACSPYNIIDISNSFFWMRDKLITERLQRRIQEVRTAGMGTQALFYTLILGALGAKANRIPFMDFAQKIHWAQLNRWRNRPERIYCYLMYLSGLFDKETRAMPELQVIAAHIHEGMNREAWQTRQIRPSGQPKKRIIELCSLVRHDIFTPLLESDDAFTFNEAWNIVLQVLRSGSVDRVKMSDFVLRNIALNAIVPFAFYRGVQSGDSNWFDFALGHLEEWPAEQNNIVKLYQEKNIAVKSGGDSQALLELYRNYCVPKKCVSCSIGASLLRA